MTGDDDPNADLKQHRVAAEMTPILERPVPFVSKRLQRRQKQFVMVPWTWVERLTKAHHIGSYKVALYVLHLNWKRSGQPFALPNRALEGLGVNRWSKWNALRELEQLGVIRVERRPRKSPIITVILQPRHAGP